MSKRRQPVIVTEYLRVQRTQEAMLHPRLEPQQQAQPRQTLCFLKWFGIHGAQLDELAPRMGVQ